VTELFSEAVWGSTRRVMTHDDPRRGTMSSPIFDYSSAISVISDSTRSTPSSVRQLFDTFPPAERCQKADGGTCLTGFMGNPTVTDTKSGVLGVRVPIMCFRVLLWSCPCLSIGWERPLLGWVTESVADPVTSDSGGHDTGGSRELIPVGRRTTALHTCFTT
jgi:hypothetical protein